MPDSMLEGFRGALTALRQLGWTVLIRDQGDINQITEGPFLTLPNDTEAAFDADGQLIRPLTLSWRGVATDAQVAFATVGLILVIPLVKESGTATILPYDTPERDLQAILRTFENLRKADYFAEAALAFTATDGWQSARSHANGDKIVFWTTQDHEDAFDDETDLVGELPLHWTGDRDEIADMLEASELEVRVPESDNEVFFLAPNVIEE